MMDIIEKVRDLLQTFPRISEVCNSIHVDFADPEPTSYGLSSTGDTKLSEDILGNQTRQHSFMLYSTFSGMNDYERLSKGDIMVWAGSLNGGIGHVAICNGVGNTKYFESYDQNWTGRHDPCTKIKHNYNHVLGVLRPKVKPILDKSGGKFGQRTTGVLAFKMLLLLAYKLKLTKYKVAKDNGFGNGTKAAVNELLGKWGYSKNGIAGVNFIKRLHTEIDKKV